MQTQIDPDGEAKIGDTLLYRLRQQDHPAQLDRLWHGRIITGWVLGLGKNVTLEDKIIDIRVSSDRFL